MKIPAKASTLRRARERKVKTLRVLDTLALKRMGIDDGNQRLICKLRPNPGASQ